MAASAKWRKWLDLITPGSGRYRKENGGAINIADAISYDPQVASRNGRLFRVYWEGQVPASTTYYFQINIPAGIQLAGFTRITTVLEGRINSQFVVAGSPGLVQESKDAHNFDERNGGSLSQAQLYRLDALNGASPRTPSIPIIAPASGAPSGRQPSSQTETGAQPVFDENNLPGFVYENPGADPVQMYLTLFWEEWESY